MDLQQRVAKALQNIGKSNEELAQLLGVNRNTISAYKKNKGDLKGIVLVGLAEQFGYNPEWLLTGEGDMTGSAAAIPQEEGPEDEIEVILELNERVEGWIQKGLVKPQAKKAMVKELYDLVSVRNKKGKGSRQEPQNYSEFHNSGVTTIGKNNKVTNK